MAKNHRLSKWRWLWKTWTCPPRNMDDAMEARGVACDALHYALWFLFIVLGVRSLILLVKGDG